ncbi:MAG: molybdopterin-dependent oxidoreductase [Actinobacteria bacterium]|nr:molybdopterin-dependent oxidoreductase [Actinomycetota bacterium]
MRSRAVAGWLAGLLSVAVAIGVGELAAVFVRPAAAPLIAVGNRVVLLTPESAKRATINSVGTDDKLLLFTVIYVVLALLGALIGQLALRDLRFGLLGLAVIGAFGCYCALTANASKASDVVPTLIGTVAAMAVLAALVRASGLRPTRADAATSTGLDRRRFLQAGLGTALLAALAGFGGRAAQHARFNVAAKRQAVVLPPATSTESLPTGVDLATSGIPWATPNSQFYRVDTALTVPQVDPDTWTLRIHGLVDREVTITWAEQLQRPMIERWITLCCVSNPVGGNLVGNALFRGTRLADLLREAGIQPQADQLLLTSVDGYTFGAPTAVVMDGRDALLAIGMNGAPLPVEHGFPVRTVVPGLYGYVSACKWIVEIEVTTFAAEQAYWVQGGWDAHPSIELASRIDTPRSGKTVTVGRPVPIAGVAWDQHVGVSAVEVQVDDGPWRPARLATVPSTDTWRQWVLTWTPEQAGEHALRVRARDGAGRPQDTHAAAPFPGGATGLDTITVRAVV